MKLIIYILFFFPICVIAQRAGANVGANACPYDYIPAQIELSTNNNYQITGIEGFQLDGVVIEGIDQATTSTLITTGNEANVISGIEVALATIGVAYAYIELTIDAGNFNLIIHFAEQIITGIYQDIGGIRTDIISIESFDSYAVFSNIYSISIRVEDGDALVTLPNGSVARYECFESQSWAHPAECGVFAGSFEVQVNGTSEIIAIIRQ